MASTRLTRSITGSNATKATFSAWLKLSGNADKAIFTSIPDGSNNFRIHITGTHQLQLKDYQSSSTVALLLTNQVFRDVGAFYHIVVSIDTSLGTADDRAKIYVNGTQVTSFASRTNYPQSNVPVINKTGTHEIGAVASGDYFDGLMSYMAVVDGNTYDASYFGETDSSSGIWKIKTGPSVTYGTNGFFLKMDTSSPGTDTSGNSNTFTASGTPTLTQDNASNVFATNNPLCNVAGRWTITNGNNTIQHANGGSWTAMISSIAPSVGKYYMEAKITAGASRTMFGVMSADTNIMSYATNLDSICLYYNLSGGEFQQSGGTTSGNNYGTFADNDIAGIALDCTNNKISIYKNGTALVTDHTIPATVDGFIGFGFTSDSNSTIYQCNYGNGFFGTTSVASSNADAAGHGLFEYAVPTGYFSLNTKNLNTYG